MNEKDQEWARAVKGFLTIILMLWLVYFSIVAMIKLAGVLI